MKPPEIPVRIAAPPEGLADHPEPISKAEASSIDPVRVAAWAGAFRRLPAGSCLGAIPATFAGSAAPSKLANEPFGDAMEVS